ncbi:DUF1127 domain-containing protein [Jiella endophytica]|uniref:DUF1127 domain-containing protein n=1 Tax=Jiella endophytica TaxID=2558362 RepID=A0A4Y8RJW0_9HYPH|nr:DUF1127 domain-containing protein [Jiella endophytica]
MRRFNILERPLGVRSDARRSNVRQSLQVVASLTALIWRWTCRHRQRRDLSDLSDWQLRDLGLTRDEAEEEARKPFWR